MKLYNSIGPNPRVVRVFAAEKGLEIPLVEVDLMAAENRREPYLQKNAAGQLPALELDNGHCITEITAICEYLEDTHPAPPLIGSTPEEKAEARKIAEQGLEDYHYLTGPSRRRDRPWVSKAKQLLKEAG